MMEDKYPSYTDVEGSQALEYNSSFSTSSVPFREERSLSTGSSQYSLVSYPRTTSISSVSSPKLPFTPQDTDGYSPEVKDISDRFGNPSLPSDSEISELSRSLSENAQLDTYVPNYNMSNLNMIGDSYWKINPISDMSCYSEGMSLLPKTELPLDGISFNLNNSFSTEKSQINFDALALNPVTQRKVTNNDQQNTPHMPENDMVRVYMRPQAQASVTPITLFESPTILRSHSNEGGPTNYCKDTTFRLDGLNRAAENEWCSSVGHSKRTLRSQMPRCREEKLRFREEAKRPKFAAYNDVKEALRKCVVDELSRTNVKSEFSIQDSVQANASESGFVSFLSSASPNRAPATGSSTTFSSFSVPNPSSSIGVARTRRRGQGQSENISIPSENLELTYIERKEPTKKFPCPKCGQKLSRREHNTRHLRGHDGLDKVECFVPNCRKVIRRNDNLIQHLSTHVKYSEKTRRPDKRISIEAMHALIREYAGTRTRAEHMIARVEAARLNLKMDQYYERHGRAVDGVGLTETGMGDQGKSVQAKL